MISLRFSLDAWSSGARGNGIFSLSAPPKQTETNQAARKKWQSSRKWHYGAITQALIPIQSKQRNCAVRAVPLPPLLDIALERGCESRDCCRNIIVGESFAVLGEPDRKLECCRNIGVR